MFRKSIALLGTALAASVSSIGQSVEAVSPRKRIPYPLELPQHRYRMPRNRKTVSTAQQKRAARKRANIRKRPACAR